ncbi:MAG: phenylacetate--CoA ligase family protein [Theionarchaea archaeon]|nr:phenylacetate--CoA ligase family protein [Theionarchaea archaeon]
MFVMFLKDLYYLGNSWRNPRKPFHTVEKYQLKMLKAAVRHAYRHSAFYHEKFRRAGVGPEDITCLKDIEKLPFTTKEELLKAGTSVVARNIPPSHHRFITTSGSTGKKLRIVHSEDFLIRVAALFYRIYWDWGMRPFKSISYIRHAALNDTVLYNSTEKYLFEKVGIAPSYYISTFMDTELQLESLLSQNPHVLVGHPPDLVALARAMRARGVEMNFDFIGSNSELLTQVERAFIEETFGCPVYNEYSSLEVGYIARDCRHKRMHLVSDSVMTEFIREGEPVAPGEKGEVVVTSLFEDATPFIRYAQGDVASYSDEECTCGITFPTMNVIEGRTDDFLRLPSGEEIPPTRVVPLFFQFDTIKEFNVIQTAPDTVAVKVVPTEQFTESEKQKLLQEILEALPGIHITLDYVDSIEKTPRGKKRAVTNEICS